MEGVGEGQESTLSTKDFKPTHDLPRTSARSNSIYCNRAPAYQDLRLAGPCTLFNAHNFFFFFFYMQINNGLPSEEGKGFLSNEIKSRQGWNSTHRMCWVALFSGSQKMRVSISSSCNTGKHDAVVGKNLPTAWVFPNLGRDALQRGHRGTGTGWN